MKRITLLFLTLVFLIYLIGCANKRALRHVDIKNPQSLQYLNDSEQIPEKKDITVYLSSVEIEKELPYEPRIEKIGNIMKPHPILGVLGVYALYAQFGSKFNYELGKKSIMEDLGSFVRQQLIKEAERSGIFNLDTTGTDYDYTLRVTFKDQKVAGPYEDKTTVIATFFWRSLRKAGPGYAKTLTDFTLMSEGEEIILDKTIPTENRTAFLDRWVKNEKEVQKQYTIAMVESLSKAYKETIEQIVQELNNYFKGKITHS